MSEKYGLSNKAITEEYEDLIFRKVMARYAENQSEKIEEEIASENAAADKNILRKLFGKKERRENAATLWKYGKKLITAAAMVVFVGVVSVSSAVVASAEAREAIAEYLYSLIVVDEGDSIVISSGWHNDIRSKHYVLGYVPAGFSLKNCSPLGENGRSEYYWNGETYFYFNEDPDAVWKVPEREEFEDSPYVNGRNFYIRNIEDDRVEIFWAEEDAVLRVIGPREMRGIIYDVAEGVIPNEKFEGERTPIEIEEEPKETYPEAEGLSDEERISPESYIWKGAWRPTYLPEGFILDGCGGSSSGFYAPRYKRRNDFIIIEQRGENYFMDSEEKVYNKSDSIMYDDFKAEQVSVATWVADKTIISIITNVEDITFDIAMSMIPSEYAKEVQYEETRYEPTYIPEEYKLVQTVDMQYAWALSYQKEEESFFVFDQALGAGQGYVPADYDEKKTMKIGESEAVYIKEGEIVSITWFIKNEMFSFTSKNLPDEEIFKIIDSLAPVEQE